MVEIVKVVQIIPNVDIVVIEETYKIGLLKVKPDNNVDNNYCEVLLEGHEGRINVLVKKVQESNLLEIKHLLDDIVYYYVALENETV